MKCLFQAARFAHDDLLLVAAGYFRIVGSHGFWLASLLMVREANNDEQKARLTVRYGTAY
jgi:hypothetical protein